MSWSSLIKKGKYDMMPEWLGKMSVSLAGWIEFSLMMKSKKGTPDGGKGNRTFYRRVDLADS